MVVKLYQMFAGRFSSPNVNTESLCDQITWRPAVTAPVLGSVLLGTSQTCTCKNCWQKEVKWLVQEHVTCSHTLCISAGQALELCFCCSVPWDGCGWGVLCLLSVWLPGNPTVYFNIIIPNCFLTQPISTVQWFATIILKHYLSL